MKENVNTVIEMTNTIEMINMIEMIETTTIKTVVIEAVVAEIGEDALEEIIVHANQRVMLKHQKVEVQQRNNKSNNNNKQAMLHRRNPQLLKLKLAAKYFVDFIIQIALRSKGKAFNFGKNMEMFSTYFELLNKYYILFTMI